MIADCPAELMRQNALADFATELGKTADEYCYSSCVECLVDKLAYFAQPNACALAMDFFPRPGWGLG